MRPARAQSFAPSAQGGWRRRGCASGVVSWPSFASSTQGGWGRDAYERPVALARRWHALRALLAKKPRVEQRFAAGDVVVHQFDAQRAGGELLFVPEGGEVGVAGAEFGELSAVGGVLHG